MRPQLNKLLLLTCLSAAPLWAAQCQLLAMQDAGCLYLGMGTGASYLAPDVSQSSWQLQQSWSLPFKGTLGYAFDPYYQFELSYTHLGSAQLDHPQHGRARVYYGAPAFWFVGNAYSDRLPQPWNLQARIGLSRLHSSTNKSALPLQQNTQVQVALGLGGYWQLDTNWRLRLDFDNYDRDARSLMLSAHYLIGAR